MAKDAYWFKHDANARADVRLVKLRRKTGLEGVGLFWCVVEMLREADNYEIENEAIEDIAYDLRTTENVFQELFNCELLVKGENTFYSNSLKSRMVEHDVVKEKRRIAGAKGGKAKADNKQKLANAKDDVANAKAVVEQTSSKALANSTYKIREEEIIGDNSTVNNNTPPNPQGELDSDNPKPTKKRKSATTPKYTEQFENFWEFYEYHGNKKKAFEQWAKLTDNQMDEIRAVVRDYVRNTAISFRKAGEVLLNATAEYWKNDSRVFNSEAYVDKGNSEPIRSKACDVSKPTGIFAQC